MELYPSALPKPTYRRYEGRSQATFQRSPTASGSSRSFNIRDVQGHKVSISFEYQITEFDTFMYWWEKKLLNGRLTAVLPMLSGDGVQDTEVEFDPELSHSMIAGQRVVVNAVVTIRKLNLISQDIFDFLSVTSLQDLALATAAIRSCNDIWTNNLGS